MSLLSVSLDCGVLFSSTSYSGFDLSLVQLMAWAEDTNIGMTLRFFIVLWILCSLFSPNDENKQLETLGEEFKLAEDIWWGEHIQLQVLRQQDALTLWGRWSYLSILCTWRCVWWDVSVLWGQYLHHRHRAPWVDALRLRGQYCCSIATLIIACMDNIVFILLYFALWIGWYSGRKTTAIQLYLADLHCECRTEHSIRHWRLKLWDVISMWRTDLESERCVLTVFCIQKKVVQRIVYESLRSWEVSHNLDWWAGYLRLDENQFALRTFGSVSIILNLCRKQVSLLTCSSWNCFNKPLFEEPEVCKLETWNRVYQLRHRLEGVVCQKFI